MAAISIMNPPDRPAPETYSFAVEAKGVQRVLHVAGQVGIGADGVLAAGIEAQAELVFANIANILKHAGMTVGNIVKATVYLTEREDREAYARIRAAAWAGWKPASTLLFVSGLAHPEMRIEVEVTAVA